LAQVATQQIFGFDLLLALGAKENSAVLRGQIWRYLTPILLHVGLTHFLVNMYSLYVIGPAVERPFGPIRFLSIYFLSGLGGVAASLAFSQTPSAGASGAIFGLLGALAGFLFLHRELLGQSGSGQLRHIVLVAVINLAIGLSPGIDNWGHLGGLLTGIALSFWLGPNYQIQWNSEGQGRMVDQRRFRHVWPRALLAAVFLIFLLIGATLLPLRF
jgi:rhomboid protease GluP